jgi:pantetheine-phosphate adenylyltransferase
VTAAVFPGSFDPPTAGHLDVIARAARLFDRLIVAVVTNPGKTPLFTPDERVAMLVEAVAGLAPLGPGAGAVEVVADEGLLVDVCVRRGARVVVKGVRGAVDLDVELSMARMNRRMGDVETVLLPTDPGLADVSSSLVREIARLAGPLAGVVPPGVEAALRARFA